MHQMNPAGRYGDTVEAKSYDTGWQDRWDDMKRFGPYSRHVRRLIFQLIEPLRFTSVLDAGCGQGELLLEIRKRLPQVTRLVGVDFSPVSIRLTQERLGTGRFEVLDLQTQILDEQCDLTMCIDVVEHIADDCAALKNLCQMTGKYTLIASVQGNRLPAWEAKVVGHVRNYKRGELAMKMQQAGFVIDQVVEWGFPFYSPFYRWVLTLVSGEGAEGEYGFKRKLVGWMLYGLFLLNSARRGDLILILAHPAR